MSPYLLVDVASDIQALLISDLDPADVKGIYYGLDCFWCASWCRCECQDAEMRILGHKEADHFGVGVLSRAFMRFVCTNLSVNDHTEVAGKLDVPMTRRTISLGSQLSVLRSFSNVCGVI